MNKLAIYDFCSTIVNFETADAFVYYCCDRLDIKYNKMVDLFVHFFSNVVGHFFHKSFFKKRLLFRIKNVQKDIIDKIGEEFFQKMIVPNYNGSVVDQMKKDHLNGFKLVVCSAAYEPYLRPFIQEMNIEYCICNEFQYSDDIFLGTIKSKDCSSKQKVTRLEMLFDDEVLKKSKAYSDSKSDLPMLMRVNTGILVSKKAKKWTKKYKISEFLI